MEDLSHGTLVFLDYFFLVFHSAYTLFSIFGWIWRKTRVVHLLTSLLTLFSWLLMGIWYGLGYCFLTDWHWDVRTALGKPPDSSSYVHFLIRETTGLDFPAPFVDTGVVVVFAVCFLLSITLNLRDYKRRKRSC
ncbi:DUF2784 domain-containing protein [Muricauda sp. SCSIO 64092]|uniref:DUF2784 domain-containing protein n=1 Tax=Allomuricauda sp. SCSIO 64092 TaxID=2908842 RepID=UPI001FF17DB9|nr:DUF2784 domain-containing protein [Muricauda sp. SCSIO 64092]UOY06837.1 DUF2784 domain-containing protein [Muricauda sp. SCSIO 64092]